MTASKENARKAHAWFRDIMGRCKYAAQEAGIVEEGQQFVEDFIAASERKLPTEASYKRDLERRRVKAVRR